MVAEATCALSCTATEFLAEATLRVLDEGKPFFLRSWLKRIPREKSEVQAVARSLSCA